MKTYLPVLGSVAAVSAVAVGVALVASTGSDGPRPLRLSSSGVARDAATAATAPASGSSYVLTGSLPAGQPDDAPAFTLPGGAADADVVAALAGALRAGTPTRTGDGWRAGGLFVSGESGQSWWYAPCAKDMTVTSGERVGCAVSSGVNPVGPATAAPGEEATVEPDAPVATPADGGGSTPTPGDMSGSGATGSGGTAVAPPPPSPAPEPDPMPTDAVRTAVAPVFRALGLDVADARVEGTSWGGSAVLTPRVGGLEAYGMQTSVQVNRLGEVQGAGGYLATPDEGDTYPLVTAQHAYDGLPPLMTAMLCPVGPDGKGCGTPQPVEITGARLGLVLRGTVDGEQALVPAWLFEVKGSTEPLPVVAVQEQYLPEPPAPTAKPEPGASTEPGGAVPPAAVDPAGRQAFSFDKAARGSTANEVVVTYGDSSSCAHENVKALAKESADAVWVSLEADPRDPDQACTEDYRAVELSVPLQAPLSDRAVFDAVSGKQVPLS